MQRCLPSTQPLQAHYKGSEILLVRHQLRVVCSHLDTLVGYFSRRRPICSITEVTNLVSKEKGLVSTQPAGAIPWISSQKPLPDTLPLPSPTGVLQTAVPRRFGHHTQTAQTSLPTHVTPKLIPDSCR